jgi:hypothetical protein
MCQVLKSISFELDQSRNFKDGHRNCITGIMPNCKNSAALFLYINNERSIVNGKLRRKNTNDKMSFMRELEYNVTFATVDASVDVYKITT